MEMARVTGSQVTGTKKILLSDPTSRDWNELTDYVDDDHFHTARDRCDERLALSPAPLDGRMALYRVKLTEPANTELVAFEPRRDIDDVEAIVERAARDRLHMR